MSDKSWKRFERYVAEQLGGRRIPVSGVSSGFKGDVLHDWFFVECKWGKQIPKTIMNWFSRADGQNKDKGKVVLVVMKPRGVREEFVLLRFRDFLDICRKGGII